MAKHISRISPWATYWVIALPLWVLFVWASFNHQASLFSWGGDFWEHSAALKTWMENLWDPGTPHTGGEEGSPRYMPFFFAVVLIAKALALGPLEALGVAGAISITVLMVFVPLFANRYFKNAWAGPITLVVLLCCWGVGWKWSNLYQMRDLFYIMAFPSFFVFSLSFAAMWYTQRYLGSDTPAAPGFIVIVLLAALMFSSHPPTGAAAIAAMGLLALTDAVASIKRRAWAIGALVLGALAVELWPWFSTWGVTFGTAGGQSETWIARAEVQDISRAKKLYWGHPFYQPQELLLTLGPALLGFPALAYLLFKGKHWFIVVGAAVMAIPYFLNLVVPIPLGHRFLFFSIFFVHLAIVWLLLKGLEAAGRARLLSVLFLGAILLWNVGLSVAELRGYSLESDLNVSNFNEVEHYPPDYMALLQEHLDEESVVMAPPYLTWPIGTYTGKVVTTLHRNPLLPDDRARREDSRRFFKPETTLAERKALIGQYGITHLFYDREHVGPEVHEELRELGGKSVAVYDLNLVVLPR